MDRDAEADLPPLKPGHYREIIHVIEGEVEGLGPMLTITFPHSMTGLRAAMDFLQKLWDQNVRLHEERAGPAGKVQ